MRVNELLEKRGRLASEMRAILAANPGELTTEQREKFDRIDADLTALDDVISREERAASIEARLAAPARPTLAGLETASASKRNSDEHRAAFASYLREGGAIPVEYRDLTSGTAASGGYLVPQGFSGELSSAMKDYSGVLAAARVFPTSTGAPIAWPTVDDTANVGELLSENTQTAALDMSFASVTLNAYIFSSKRILVSNSLLQDSAFPVDSFLAQKFAERIGRSLNAYLTTGTGTSQPKGVVTAASLGKTGTTGQTLSVIYEDLVDLMHAVDPSYRKSAKCGYMMNDSSLKVVRKLKDSQNRPLWEPSLQAGQPDTLLGYPVWVNSDMAAMAANAKSILFGDFSQYIVREAMAVSVMRSEHIAADKFQTMFAAFARYDGNFVGPTSALKYYANSAT